MSLAAAAVVLGGLGRALGEELKPGDKAPVFKLQGSDGETYQLSDFRGKRAVVLAWFPKAFTSGCTLECKSFRAEGKAIKDLDAAYFTASIDIPETNKKFAQSLELDYPILSDPEGKTARAYGVVDDQQKLPRRWTFFIGKDGKILAIDKAVKVQTHATDVAARLKELGAEKK